MSEFFIAAFIGAWSCFIGVIAYIKLKKEYGEDEKK